MPADETLMKAADEARAIADRLSVKADNYLRGNPNWKHFIAMSAGARLVAVKLVELAEEADRAAGLPTEGTDG